MFGILIDFCMIGHAGSNLLTYASMISGLNNHDGPAPEPPGRVSGWASVPLAFLVVAMTLFWLADPGGVYDPPWLLFTCNFICATLTSALVFRLICRSFLASGAPSLLFLACGVVSWGLAGVLAVGFGAHEPNAMVTIHNLCAWLSAGFHLIGILWSGPRRRLKPEAWWLLGGVLAAVCLALLVVTTTVAHWTPLFFVQGTGGTAVRFFVLASATAMFVVSAVILRGRQREAPSVFAQWYGLGLWLIAAGMTGLMVQTVHGSALGWTARAAGWLGGVYLLMAARASAGESGDREISLATPPTDVRLRYLLAVVFVATAVVVRMMLSDHLGSRAAAITFFPAIILAALYGGRGPGLLAGVLSVIAIKYFWMEPFSEFTAAALGDWIVLGILMLSAAAISFLAEAMQTARLRASAAEAEVRLGVEKQRLKQASDQVEQRLFSVLAGMSDGFEIVDSEWRVTYLNAAARSMFSAQGLDAEQMIGRHLWQDIYPDLQDTPLYLERHRGMSERLTGEIVNFYPHWQRWYAMRFFPTEDGGQSTLFQDITERAEAEETRSRLAAIVESSEDAIIGKNLDGFITSWNRSAERLFGYTVKEIVGQPVTVLMPPERYDEEAEILRHFGRGERVEHFETVRRRKDGTYFDVSLTASPVKNAEGEVIGASKIVRDITARKQAEDALRTSEEFKRSIIESSPDCIKVLDLHGNLLSLEVGHDLFGISDFKPFIGKSWIDLWLNPEDRAAAVAAVAAAVAGETGKFVGFFRTMNGLDKWWDVAVAPIRHATGKPIRLLAVSRDVTVGRLLEEALVARAEQLARADRSKDEFLAMLAHELRNPLAPMRNAAELLKTENATEENRAQALRIMGRQIENMSRLLEDLLDVSRITEGKIELRRKPVQLESILTAAVSLLRTTCAEHRQKLTVSLPKQPVFLNADATRLEQVFGNLLANAYKYSGDGSHISISTELFLNAEPPEVVVTVRDDGAGIDPELLPHIFGLFVQASRSLDRSHGGLGIGLTLVQRLVNLHGGSVQVHSEGLGCGAAFVVHLPILTEAPFAEESSPSSLAVPSSLESKRRILIVDDNTDAALSLSTLQQMLGHETRTAFTGPDAIAAATAFLPDFMLLDIGLPGMDGFEVARRIRAIPELAGVRLMAMSGYGREEDREEAKQAGFDLYIVKPIDLTFLREWLSSV